MKYGLKKPCKTCPFVREHNFPLNPERIREIADADFFSCHNTVDYGSCSESEDGWEDLSTRDKAPEHHCLGHLIVQWAEYRGFNGMTGFMASHGEFDPHELPTPEESGCFDTFGEYAEREEGR